MQLANKFVNNTANKFSYKNAIKSIFEAYKSRKEDIQAELQFHKSQFEKMQENQVLDFPNQFMCSEFVFIMHLLAEHEIYGKNDYKTKPSSIHPSRGFCVVQELSDKFEIIGRSN